jgi:hypothetical protein
LAQTTFWFDLSQHRKAELCFRVNDRQTAAWVSPLHPHGHPPSPVPGQGQCAGGSPEPVACAWAFSEVFVSRDTTGTLATRFG